MTAHCSSFRSKGQQGNIPGLLDCIVELALMSRTNAGYPARHDLGAFRDELRQQFHILVVDHVDPLDTELTNFLSAVILFLPGRPFLFHGFHCMASSIDCAGAAFAPVLRRSARFWR